MRLIRISSTWLLGLAAAGVFALAYFQPVETVDSDPAIALVVSQALLDHQTLRLDVYRGNPDFAYDLADDYRIRRVASGTYYYSPSVAVLSLPFVALANAFGFHMLDRGAERALQNLLSALCCAAVVLLLFAVCRRFLEPIPSLIITAVSVLGSPLASTGATGLWNSAYAAVFLSLAVLHLVKRDADLRGPSYAYLAAVLAAAFIARPASAFAAVALAAYLLSGRDRRTAHLAGAGLALLVAAVFASWLGWARWLPTAIYYYSPTRLFPQTPIAEGLLGTLLSPSRGLLVFCPFLVVIAAGAAWQLSALKANRLFFFAATWIALHVPAAATRPVWWGGHSFGPRLFAEVMPAVVLVTCLLWQRLAEHASPKWRAALVACYLATGTWAIFVHSYQALFNPHTRAWNERPNVDDHREVLFDWRHPQFLASEALLERRIVEHQRRNLDIYEMGSQLAYDTSDAVFRHWYRPEGPADRGWRWSRGRSPSIGLRLGGLSDAPLYLLEVRAGSLTPQDVTVTARGTTIGNLPFDGFEPVRQLVAIPPSLLRSGEENVVRFEIPSPGGTADDHRRLGIALRSFCLSPLPGDFTGVELDDDAYFLSGFSSAEASWRWTDGIEAVIGLPVAAAADPPYSLELRAGALGRQRVTVSIDGDRAGELIYEGFEPVTRRIELEAGRIRPYHLHRIQLAIPGAVAPPGETRRLGLAIRSIRLAPSTRMGAESGS